MRLFHPTFRSFLLVCVNGFCLGFVIWKTIECVNYYMDKPIGTKLGMKKSTDLPFPAITICGKFGMDMIMAQYFNETYLKEKCDITKKYIHK